MAAVGRTGVDVMPQDRDRADRRVREGVTGVPETRSGVGRAHPGIVPGPRCGPSYTRPRRRSRRRRSQAGTMIDRSQVPSPSPSTSISSASAIPRGPGPGRPRRPDGHIRSPILARRADPQPGPLDVPPGVELPPLRVLPRSAPLGARSRAAGPPPGRLAGGSGGGRRRPDRSRGASAGESLHDLLRGGIPRVHGPRWMAARGPGRRRRALELVDGPIGPAGTARQRLTSSASQRRRTVAISQAPSGNRRTDPASTGRPRPRDRAGRHAAPPGNHRGRSPRSWSRARRRDAAPPTRPGGGGR